MLLFRHITAIVICLFCFVYVAPLHAQISPVSSIVFTRFRTGIGQGYSIDQKLSLDTIQNKWNEGSHIYRLTAGDYGYGIIMNAGRIPQKILISDSIPQKQLQDYLALGYRITSLTSRNGAWYFVLSIDNSIYYQHVIVNGTFPGDQINRAWDNGYRISTLDFNDGIWCIVMNRAMFTSGQTYSMHDTLPPQLVQSFRKKYLVLSQVFDLGSGFCSIGDGNIQAYDQIILQDNDITKDTITHFWEKGYTIVSISLMRNPIFINPAIKTNQYEFTSTDILQRDLRLEDSSALVDLIQATAPSESAFLSIQKLAALYFTANDRNNAIATCKMYRLLMKGYEQRLESLQSLYASNIDSLELVNLGSPVNTTGSEWDPIPSPDGKSLFMSVRDRRGGEGRQDVFVASRSTDTLQKSGWDTPKSLGPSVNSKNGEETVDNVSTDGNTLFLSGTFPGSYGKFDIYTAERTENGWDNLRQFPRPINSEFHDESGCMSSDGKVVLFASDRPGATGNTCVPMGTIHHGGTHGNMDVYAVIKTDTGWSEPINLGPTVNTPFSERSIFLHPDGRTLYFSSDGHYGLGGLDVFKTTRLKEDSWTEWSKPQNLGRNINTIEDDFSYKITVGGDTAYFAAQNKPGGLGDWDIYRVVIPKNIRPMAVATIKGKVLDKKGNPVKATIIWEDLETHSKVGSSTSNPQNGDYFIVLPLGKHYGYYASSEGYFPSSSSINVKSEKKSITKSKNIILSPLPDSNQTEITVELSNVFFDYANDALKPESYNELDRLVSILKKIQFASIEISGHTDDIGSESFNKRLSTKRAMNVLNYLSQHGISSKLMKAKGYGNSQPKNKGISEEDRAANRRVEVRIVK